MKKIIFFKRVITFLNFPRFIIHIFFYYLSKNRVLISQDIKIALDHRNFKINILYGLIYLLVFDRTFRNVFYYRLGYLKYLCSFIASPHPSFTIGTYTTIGSGILAIHSFSTIINAKSIGENFTIKNDVTIGLGNLGLPLIKDNVEINAGAIVIGGITIGNNVVIGAGSVVTKNIPDNCVVIGNPAFIVRRNGVKVKDPL